MKISVVVRRWRYGADSYGVHGPVLVYTREYKRVMKKLLNEESSAVHEIVTERKHWSEGAPYDLLHITIP
jgi:hypothetical protein